MGAFLLQSSMALFVLGSTLMDPTLIAIVEDDKAIANLLESLLSEEGYATCYYESGQAAYLGVLADPPQLIITDMQMEHDDAGLELLHRLHQHAATAQIPVILYSAAVRYLRQKVEEQAITNAVILEKPFDIQELLQQVEQGLSQGSGVEGQGSGK